MKTNYQPNWMEQEVKRLAVDNQPKEDPATPGFIGRKGFRFKF